MNSDFGDDPSKNGKAQCSSHMTLDPHNGLLLSPTLDALFDRKLISFAKEGGIIVSNLLSLDELHALGVSGDEKIDVDPNMEPYLAEHRAAIR
ncbi:MAG: HNH endonuclease signature motif containing protein [Erythrobacter sp.]